LYCKKVFRPDPRQKGRQRYCSDSPCRKASKKASQQTWLGKPENKNYFSGPEHVQRVQAWRAKNPGYSRSQKHRLSEDPLQDSSLPQATDNVEEKEPLDGLPQHALQDLLTQQPSVFIGLIAKLTGETLQDQIVRALDELVALGADILNNPSQGKPPS
jgi:hypothetical protein